MNTEKMLTKSLLLLTVIAALTAVACSESQPKVDAVNVKFSEMMLLYIVADKNSTLSQEEFDDWLEKEFEMVFPSVQRQMERDRPGQMAALSEARGVIRAWFKRKGRAPSPELLKALDRY